MIASARLYVCTARGVLRIGSETPLIGDFVEIFVTDANRQEASIDAILPRKNSLPRPAVANVDQVIITACEKNPSFNPGLLDRFLVMAEGIDAEVLICINKASGPADFIEPYIVAGYNVVYTDALSGFGIGQLKERMAGKLSLFAGPSGVGKSSLINALVPGLGLATGELSQKTSRGKHTTRHTEIFPLGDLLEDGRCFDTPGFSSVDCAGLERSELAYRFREIAAHQGGCRFINCSHISEAGCAVKAQVGVGIHSARYESYVKMAEDNEKRDVRRK